MFLLFCNFIVGPLRPSQDPPSEGDLRHVTPQKRGRNKKGGLGGEEDAFSVLQMSISHKQTCEIFLDDLCIVDWLG